jgi:hypothetical protein
MEMHSIHTKGTKTNVFFLQEGMSQSTSQTVNITQVDPKYTKINIFQFFNTSNLF